MGQRHYTVVSLDGWLHTPSIAFRHLPPNSARSLVTPLNWVALFIFVQLSTDAVSSLRPLKGSGTDRHTPSTAFLHLPPYSARFGYAIEGALFISAQLSSDAVSALRKVRYCRSNLAPKHARKRETHPPRVKKRVPSRWWVDAYVLRCQLTY